MLTEVFVVDDRVEGWWVVLCEGWMRVLTVKTFLETIDPGVVGE